MTLAAALPSASNVSLLAERFGANSGRVARIIMFSTVVAFGSFSLLAWWFGVKTQRIAANPAPSNPQRVDIHGPTQHAAMLVAQRQQRRLPSLQEALQSRARG